MLILAAAEYARVEISIDGAESLRGTLNVFRPSYFCVPINIKGPWFPQIRQVPQINKKHGEKLRYGFTHVEFSS